MNTIPQLQYGHIYGRYAVYLMFLVGMLLFPARFIIAQTITSPAVVQSAVRDIANDTAKLASLPNYHGELLRWQKDSLAQIVAVSTTEIGFIHDVLVWNTAPQASLIEVQIGVIIWSDDPTTSKGAAGRAKEVVQVLISPSILTAVSPGQAEALGTMPWRTETVLRELAAQGQKFVAFQVGIVAAKWNDGSSFSYDLAQLRDFTPHNNAQLEQLIQTFDLKRIEQFTKEAEKRAVKFTTANQPFRSPN
jgi:hypothetical protein